MAKKNKDDKLKAGERSGAEKKDADKKVKARKKEASEDALRELAPAIVQAARSVRTELSRNLAECGLYAGQDGVIHALSGADGMTPGALAARLGVKAPTMTRTIHRLEAQGFVERRDDSADGRLTKVYLTAAGEATLTHIEAATEECNRLAVKGFSGKDVRTLVKLLKSMDANLLDGRASDG
ncbi:MarR family winged helix-turn-helix transcriptional regulator [Rhizobium halophytocola]|uniref:DNA-binding MarR family transcriptional regulator n=1 Tax=Rhizobium halophytocola TaxID=735519 RepID=A0ABS4DTH9_9HYPH|nr:MarR family transcriptional regulator [Rhizobium halophytocola]MBP1848977.1 DNA-binding MarR family transcriptional regulator [Rhizobium halophytocola]